jgi:hypothetical protein
LVEVLALPEKRGPAREVQACYRVLDRTGETDIGDPKPSSIHRDARP